VVNPEQPAENHSRRVEWPHLESTTASVDRRVQVVVSCLLVTTTAMPITDIVTDTKVSLVTVSVPVPVPLLAVLVSDQELDLPRTRTLELNTLPYVPSRRSYMP
jgi:hypothetical protein